MKRILLVEDDLSLINGLSFAVKKQGYDLNIARTSCEASAIWKDGNMIWWFWMFPYPMVPALIFAKKSGRPQNTDYISNCG